MPGALDCLQVSIECPVSASIYGYVPSLAGSAIFVALFAVFAIAHVVQGIRYRTWSFMAAMAGGTAIECIGYGGRLMMNPNPFSDVGFKLQIILLTIAPAFLAAGIYLTLRQLVEVFGASFSRLPPIWYTYLFIGCDLVSIGLQGAGGGLAASQGNSTTGNTLMLLGLSFQVFTLIVFAMLSFDYFWSAYKHRAELNPQTVDLRRSTSFKLFIGAIGVAYVTILIRCCYRVAEMAGGWRNPIMQNEGEFIALDSVMCVLAVLALTLFHMGRFFRSVTKFDVEGAKVSATSSEGDFSTYPHSEPKAAHSSPMASRY
ncbi:MAG: hypothetical protein M1812_006341 [Candelaria pacifica]|nr:MAG: hypothetical protein M1812_006341 [Candelaria pacifica]